MPQAASIRIQPSQPTVVNYLKFPNNWHPPNYVNFRELLYEKKNDLFIQANNVCACSEHLTLTVLTGLSEQKCLNGENLAQLEGGLIID